MGNKFLARMIGDFDECSITLLHDKMMDTKMSLPRAIANLVSNPYLRCPVAFIFAIYLVFAFWGWKNLRSSFFQYFVISILMATKFSI